MKFREKLSHRILALNREAEGIKEMFRDMAANHPPNLKIPVFKNGEKHYKDLLDMNLPLVIQGVEEDLQRAKAELEKFKNIKESSVKKLVEIFE